MCLDVIFKKVSNFAPLIYIHISSVLENSQPIFFKHLSLLLSFQVLHVLSSMSLHLAHFSSSCLPVSYSEQYLQIF